MTEKICTSKILLVLLIRLRTVNLQFHMYPMSPIFALPPPPPIAIPIPIGIPIPQSTTTSTTTTTTQQNVPIAVPFPMPLPIQIAIPAMPPPSFCQGKARPRNCPPCPPCVCAPSCTPPFFSYCSPCHLKCKCNKREDVPQPLPPNPPQPFLGPAFPMPVPFPPIVGPPPLVVLPYPSRNNRGKRPWKRVASSDDTSSSSSSEWGIGRRDGRSHKRNRNRMRNSRRNYKVSDMELSDSELVKPVLTYVSGDGDVKFKKRISTDEAAQLLGEKVSEDKLYQTVRVMAGGNDDKESQVMVVSNDGELPSVATRRKQVVLKRGASQHILGEGKKELVFRPPDDKIISNLSVSFQVI